MSRQGGVWGRKESGEAEDKRKGDLVLLTAGSLGTILFNTGSPL